MRTIEFLSYLRSKDVRISLKDNQLEVNAPEGVLTDELRTELAKRKSEVIDFLCQVQGVTTGVLPAIRPVPRKSDLPLSFSQQRMWLMQQFETNVAAFNTPAAIKLSGRLNIPALEASLNEIVYRHEVLRTVFVSKDGCVFQNIIPNLKVDLLLVDLRKIPRTEREAKARQLYEDEIREPFDLTQGPLIRVKLLQEDDGEYILFMILHHIVSDDWSLNVLLNELALLYTAYCAGEPAPLVDLPVQYADFAVWQREWVESSAAQELRAYWKKCLNHTPSLPEIPVDHPHPRERTGRRAKYTLTLPSVLTEQLKILSKQEESTLFMTLLAGLKVLLHQYSAQTDIVVAAPIAGRTHSELEKLIGFFVNTVILRTDLSGNPTFRRLLGRVRKITSGAHANQALPFEEVVKELEPNVGMRHLHVFFNMLSTVSQVQEINLPGLKTRPFLDSMVRSPEIGGGFNLTLIAVERNEEIHFTASFNEDVFEKSTIKWLLTHLRVLLERTAADADRSISELPRLAAFKHKRVEPDKAFNRFPKQGVGQSLVERFEKQVARYPDRIAVDANERTLTYNDLNCGANRLARVILERYDDRLKLNRDERIRYARQIPLWGMEGQEKLKDATVFVAGAGGTGSPILVQLALCGVGTLIVCDGDNVELSNLNRQFLHDESRIGMNKALSAQLTLQKINPHVKVIAHTQKITKENVYELVGDSAMIFDNVDDLEAKFVLSECAVAKGIPHIISSLIDLSSYVAIFHPPHTPCFHCLYDRSKVEEIKAMRDQVHYNQRVPNPVSSPALFTSTGFACNEGIKILLGLENPAYNKYFFFNQKASPDLVRTQGYQIVTYPFSKHFKQLSKRQGFDWGEGWSGKFVEEITLASDPECPICAEKAGAKGSSRFSIVIGDQCTARQSQAECTEGSAVNERTVALLLGHDEEMLTGMMGVLKAGMIFVTLDSNYPEHRLVTMLEDSEARLIVTNAKNLGLAEKIKNKVNKHIKLLNIRDIKKNVPDENLTTYPDPDRIAYIVYTSGSTGKPKGVTQSHRNVLHFTMNYTNGLHISKDDKLSLVPTFSFSAAMMDVFAALCNGATLFPYDLRQKGIAGLGEWLVKKEITVYHSVPTVFRHFVATLADDVVFPHVRLIDFGGEPVSRTDVEMYKKHFTDHCILVNGLGATELNVIRQFHINKHSELAGNSIPVGYAVEDTEILLLDEKQVPVGFNRPGEIVIKSKYLSPGYWQSPEQTDAVFKTDPQGGGERLYFTGDLGCMRPDGCLEHLGRKDLQVKIRGVRIELTEIEGVLLKHEKVQEAAVAVKEDQAGEKILSAYIVPKGEVSEFSLDELRDALLEYLPAYMLPSEFVLLKALPLTQTGKIDRRALPETEKLVVSCAETGTQGHIAPRTPVEKKLAEIWSEVLDVKRIGIHDSFFDLGGDSLRALRAMDKIRQAGLNFTSQQLFQHRTIAELAALEGDVHDAPEMSADKTALSDSEPVVSTGSEYTGLAGPIPVIPATFWCKEKIVYGNWWQFFEWLLEVPKPFAPEMLQQVIRHMVRHHEALRLRMVSDDTSLLGIREFIVHPDNDHAEYWTVRDISAFSDEEQERIILDSRDAYWASLSTANGPTLKFVLFNLGPDKLSRLLIMVHHFATDAYSIAILQENFNTACQQVLRGETISLPPPSTTLREWAERMYNYTHSDAAQREIDYHRSLPWNKVRIPLDYPDVPVSEAMCKEFTVSLDTDETQVLLHHVPTAYNVSIMDVLLTAFLVAVNRCWQDVNTLAFETFDSNRYAGNGMDLSRLVGFIGHTHDEVLQIKSYSDPEKVLKSVHEQRLKIPNNGTSWQWVHIHRYISDDTSFIPHMPYDFIRFNYLGHQVERQNLMRTYPLPPHKLMTKKQIERARFECWASVMEDRFTVKWKYYPAYHKPDTAKRLSREYMDSLRFLIKKMKS